MAERVLVTGGCGYIGTHVVALLLELGHRVVVLDDLSRGSVEALKRAESLGGRLAQLAVCDLTDGGETRRVVADCRPSVVLHLAAYKSVAESVASPDRYRDVNVGGTASLIEALTAEYVERVVYASTGCVYASTDAPLTEDAELGPTSPYAQTKLEGEGLLQAFAEQRRAGVVSLRFFNVAGAHPSGLLGDAASPARNLVPAALGALADDQPLQVFGRDWPTRDGTCVRDYVHVMDVAWGLIDAMEQTFIHGSHRRWNLGTGRGATVLEVLAAAERATGRAAALVDAPRRPGDPASLVADASRAAGELGWVPRFGLDDMLAHAWAWEQHRRSV